MATSPLRCLPFVLVTLAACDSSAPMVPLTDSGPPPMECDPEMLVIETDTATPDGHADPLAVPADQARAGRIDAAELPTDPNGLAVWAAGDFVLANGKVAVIIEDTGDSDLYDPWGGMPVGIARIEGGRLVEPSDLNEIIVALGKNTLRTERVVVMDDGSDGSSAVVRAVGTLEVIPFIADFPAIDTLVSGDYSGTAAAVDWVLEPDAEHLDVYVHFVNVEDRERVIPLVLHAFFQQSRMPSFSPGRGFDTAMGMHSRVAFVEDGATSYAWESADGPMESFLAISGFTSYTSPRITIPACEAHRRHHAKLHVGGPGLDGLGQAIARTDRVTLREITGTVLDAAGDPAQGVRVHAESEGAGYLTRASTDAAGAFTLHVPNGPVTLTPYRSGEALGDPVAVATDATTAMLQMPPSGLIHVVATEPPPMGSMDPPAPIPVRVQVIPATAVEPPPAYWGEDVPRNGRLHLQFPVTGDVTLRAPPGRHSVVVSRGYEYETSTDMVTVVAGETVEVASSLSRVVDTTGILCGDFHIHTSRSPDSGDDARLKVASAVADGLEIPVRSDHEFVADFEPVIAELGVGNYAYGVPAEELTTFAWGHFNVAPLNPIAAPNGGAFQWVGMLPPEVFAMVRASPDDPVLIINHPRAGGGLGAIGAYFDAAEYDPDTGMVGRMEYWDEEFDVVEVFNDSDFAENREGTVADWFSFLRAGRRVFAVGSSDSHSVSGSPVGYPRTCLYVDTDNPRSLTHDIVRAATRGGHSTISGGIYVDLQAVSGTFGPGDDVVGAGLNGRFTVTVQAASWVDVDRVRIFVDGVETETIELAGMPLPDPLDPVLRFQQAFEVEVGLMGTWVLAEAEGDDALEPVHPGRTPFGVTNPMFFQR